MKRLLSLIIFLSFILFAFSLWAVTTITDDFAGTANPLGGSWVTHADYVALQKVSGRARDTNSTVTGQAYYNSVIAANQWAQVTIATAPPDAANGALGLIVRAVAGSTSGDDTAYTLKAVIYLGVHYYHLSRRVSGSGTDLYFVSEPWVQGDVIRLEAQGTTLRMYRNAVQVGSDITDATLSSGYVGISIDGFSDLATAELDDFSAGDFTTTPSVGVSRRVVGIQ